MANTYTQIHIQFVFAVKYRTALIHKEWSDRLHKYITGIIQSNEHKLLQVNSMLLAEQVKKTLLFNKFYIP